MNVSKLTRIGYESYKGFIENSKFCKDCKFFFPESKIDDTFGKCALYGKLDMVTGKFFYGYAGVVRQFICKGNLFEKK